MKNKLLSLASLLAVFNANAIEIGPTGSGAELGGFVDYSAVSQGDETSPVSTAQVELNLDYSTGPVSFSLDFDLTAADDTSGNLEEAVLTYSITDSLSFSVGRMLSYLGFEAYDPTNMYQFSYAYDYASGVQDIYDAYADGFSVDYATDMFSVGIWTDFAEKPSFEYALAFTGVENLTAKAIFAEYGDDADDIMTLWVSYQLGKLLLGVEFATDEKNLAAAPGTAADFTDDDIDAFMIMGNYALTDSAALTLRFSSAEYTDGTTSVEVDKFTVSPSYAFTDNFSGLFEYSTYDIDGVGADPGNLAAIELIYTF